MGETDGETVGSLVGADEVGVWLGEADGPADDVAVDVAEVVAEVDAVVETVVTSQPLSALPSWYRLLAMLSTSTALLQLADTRLRLLVHPTCRLVVVRKLVSWWWALRKSSSAEAVCWQSASEPGTDSREVSPRESAQPSASSGPPQDATTVFQMKSCSARTPSSPSTMKVSGEPTGD